MIHALITMVLAAMAWPFGFHVEVSAMVAAFYCGREHAQAEHRAISSLYCGKRANAPWWCGFLKLAWNKKSIYDFIVPVAFFVAVFSLK